jgi:3'(2'), 5'-bisphosphate nucleotidase
VLGAVALPATGEVFWGRLGAGAFKRDAAGTRAIAARAAPVGGIVVMGSHHYRDDPRMGSFLAGRQVARIVNIGSAEKFCRLAEGTADLYPRFGTTMEWDTAAPQAVLEAAGGSIRLLDGGGTLTYGKPGWANPGFVCEGRRA